MKEEEVKELKLKLKEMEIKLNKYKSRLSRKSKKYNQTQKMVKEVYYIRQKKPTWKKVLKIIGKIFMFLFFLDRNAVRLNINMGSSRRKLSHKKWTLISKNNFNEETWEGPDGNMYKKNAWGKMHKLTNI